MPGFKRFLPLLLLMLAPSAEAAGYRFESGERYDDPEGLHLHWAQMIARHRTEAPAVTRCLARRDRCPSHLRGLHVLVNKSRGLNVHAQLQVVNRFVNKRRAVVDPDVTPPGETRWKTLSAFLRNGGDCEDFALAKYFILRALEVPAEQMRIVSVFDHEAKDFHALLAVHIDGESLLLELDNSVRKPRKQRQYEFAYAINENAIWNHDYDGVIARRLH